MDPSLLYPCTYGRLCPSHARKRCRLDKTIRELKAIIEALERDETLCRSACFGERQQAIDRFEDVVLDPIEHLLAAGNRVDELQALWQRAERASGRLEAINEKEVLALRASVRSGKLAGKDLQRQLVAAAASRPEEDSQNIVGYDGLDTLVSRLLLHQIPPQQTRAREPEMVFYQPTPARLVLALVETADLQTTDVFYDLGSGLGQVVMLVSLLSGAKAKGIEFEPAYSDYARQSARNLNITGVEFIADDVRGADLSDGTLFFMYTPCEGQMLEQVLKRLRAEAQGRTLRIYSYGPSNLVLAAQAWLEALDENSDQVYRLAGFRSVSRSSQSLA